ncbi:hypothetical protein BV394_10120 [Brevirhabdus pacifica]|uniref:CAAX prenyl protease 2/Lysostaphin resistance protein A-like domain-containing protein n=2 Tax=Brevirhabdus pacifica TaxID=1267768 RepID=A0A1U7DJI0_9RHOB|nr:type II CAAX endopeptidase family protein [Brevirhabdus pacifica]APX90028.1 hypothetical protein BV394_10120 [Brevirhabdus pacifica]PJJ82727.1 hypothetical protein CLV77_2501 [Brevirhabdus pacifica]
MRLAYSRPLQRLIAPARRRPALWRLALGVVLGLAVYGVPLLGAGLALRLALPEGTGAALMQEVAEGATPRGLLLALASFGFMALAPIAAAWLLHRRGAGTLFGPRAGLWRNFLRVTAVLSVMQVAVLIVLATMTDLEPNVAPATWLMLLPLSLPLLLLQVSAEEMVFRGYLMQQLAARFRSPLIWMFLPAVLFGIGHFSPQDAGANAWVVAAWATLFAVYAADLTARTGDLGAAIGFHFINNFFSLLLVSLQGPMSGLSLYTLPFDGADDATLPGLLWAELAVLTLAWALCLLVARPWPEDAAETPPPSAMGPEPVAEPAPALASIQTGRTRSPGDGPGS